MIEGQGSPHPTKPSLLRNRKSATSSHSFARNAVQAYQASKEPQDQEAPHSQSSSDMSEPNETSANSPETSGGGGALFQREDNLRSDSRLVERAGRRKWNIPPLAFDALPQQMAHLAASKDSRPRTKIAATRALVSMHGQNQADDPAAQKLNVNLSGEVVHVRELRVEFLNEPNYLEYQRACAEHADASLVCQDGEPRALENGTVPGALGSGNNGHTNGRH